MNCSDHKCDWLADLYMSQSMLDVSESTPQKPGSNRGLESFISLSQDSLVTADAVSDGTPAIGLGGKTYNKIRQHKIDCCKYE